MMVSQAFISFLDISYLDFQGLMGARLESTASSLAFSPLSSALETTGSWTTRLTNNATRAVQAAVDSSMDAGGKTRDRWNGVRKC